MRWCFQPERRHFRKKDLLPAQAASCSMDVSEVRWSQSEYTLNGYASKFAFPDIIKITEGFLGKQEIDSVSSSTVIRVHSVCNQKRVVAESKEGKLFSLPIKLKSLRFLIARPGSELARGPVMQNPVILEEILSRYNLPVTVHSSNVLSFKEKGDMKSPDETLSELTLRDTYQEDFLLGHPIDKGKLLLNDPIMIPMYMTELKLVVGVGFMDGNQERWSKISKEFTNQVKYQGNNSRLKYEEIFLIDKSDLLHQEPRYTSFEPTYIDISELRLNKKVQLENTGTLSVEPKLSTGEDTVPEKNLCGPSQSGIQAAKKFVSLADIPGDLHDLNVKQVCECLELLNMNQYVDAFQGTQVDGQLLYDLDKEMMKSCMGMNGLHITKLLKFRDGWRPNLEG
ncbi:hypothetical protein FKM82_028766 [Ascaphus truei]